MSSISVFVRRSIIGGVLVVAPLVIIALLFHWLFNAVTDLIHPLTAFLIGTSGWPQLLGDILVIACILVAFFLIGTVVSTGAGRWLHAYFDKYLIKLAPGYRMVREIVNQFLGDNKDSPFNKGEVARAYIFGPNVETSATVFVTSRHPDGSYTVFAPTGPNPTSGFIYHLPASQVVLMPELKMDSALRTIIACGAGSAELFAQVSDEQRAG